MKTLTQKSSKKKSFTANKVDMKEVFFSEILQKIDKVNADEWEHYIKETFDLAPRNAFTNYHYKRLNRINLMIDMFLHKRKSPLYATFKQISERKGIVKKGSKGLLIEFFSWSIKHKDTGISISVREFNLLSKEMKKLYHVFPISRFYRVFNMDDVDTSEMDFTFNEAEIEEEPDIVMNDDIETSINNLVEHKGLVIQEKLSGVAFYSPGSDKITMPNKDICVSMDKYYSALFHEIIHWTGHFSRLDRSKAARRGDGIYAFEELIAEIGSMLLCLDFNITSEFINSLRYIKGWSKATIDNWEKEFRNAFIQSQTAVSFLSK